MKLIAKHTINLGAGKMAAPGDEFDLSDDGGKALIAEGAAVRKTRQVADDGNDTKLALADVIAMAEKEGVTLAAFKKAAAGHLQTVPDKKELILEALLALPPETPV